MSAKTRNAIKWNKSVGGSSRFAFIRSCKLVEVWGLYVVERVTDGMPTGAVPGSPFSTLESALEAINAEPEATCFRCGGSVVPGNQVPDPDLPCPK